MQKLKRAFLKFPSARLLLYIYIHAATGFRFVPGFVLLRRESQLVLGFDDLAEFGFGAVDVGFVVLGVAPRDTLNKNVFS